MGLAAALEALDHDIKIWQETSDTLHSCAMAARSIVITTSDSSIISDITGFNSSYEQTGYQARMLLFGGAAATRSMALTMLGIYEDFQRNDAEAAARLRGEWEVRTER